MTKDVRRKIRVPEIVCPKCGYTLDACTPIEGLDSPSVGDITICIGCGEFLEFGDHLVVRSLTLDKLYELSISDSKAYSDLMSLREFIIKRNQEKPLS